MVCHWLARPCCSQNGAYTGLLGLSRGYTWKRTEAHCRDWCVQTLKGDAGHSGWHVITGHTWQTWVTIDGRKWHSDPAPLNLDLHRKSLQIVKPFLNLSRKNQQTVKALLSGYLFSFFFYGSHHSDPVSPRFPLRENIPIPYCNIYICWYVHVSELFHVVSTFISVNSCTLFNSLKQLEQLMYLAVCKWLTGS